MFQIFRHGEKTPDFYYLTDPWKETLSKDPGHGQLTKVSKTYNTYFCFFVNEIITLQSKGFHISEV